MRRVAGTMAVAAAVYALAALAAPFIDAPALREPLRLNLEKSLGRPVELREVRYRLFPRPGLSAEDVVIGEDARFGLEPLAYVGTLHADIAISSLWRTRLEIADVRLVDSSVNLAHSAEAGWNLADLLDRMTVAVPSFQLRSGRINFRDGTLKAPFYLNDVDLDLTAGSGGFEWSYEASPARTDRAEAGFGRFIGRGSWSSAATSGVDIDIELERSTASEVVTLFAGRDLGIPGRVASRAHLSGPVSNIRITGSIQFEGLDRSAFLGLRGPALRVPYSGELDLGAQRLRLSSPESGAETPPFSFLLEVADLLTKARWSTALRFEKVSAGNALELARRFGTNVPPDLQVTGQLDGSLRLAQEQSPAGQIELRDADVRLGASPSFHLDTATLQWAGSTLHLDPAAVRWGTETRAEVSGSWPMSGESLDFSVNGTNLPLADLRAVVPPLLGHLEGGTLSGALDYHRSPADPGSWKGAIQLANVAVRDEGLPPGLVIERAQAAIKGEEVILRRARLLQARTAWDGEVAWRPAMVRPLRFRLSAAQASGAALESWLRLAATRGTFLERTLRRRPALPAWLRARRAEGDLSIGTLDLGDYKLDHVQSHLYWDGPVIDVPSLDALWNEARFSGRLAVRLDGPSPSYRLRGRFDNLSWKSARGELEFEANSSGYGSNLLHALRAEGTLNARNIPLGEETARTGMACLDYGADRLRLRCLEFQIGPDLLTAPPSTSSPEGRLTSDLSSARRSLRLTIDLSPLEVLAEVH